VAKVWPAVASSSPSGWAVLCHDSCPLELTAAQRWAVVGVGVAAACLFGYRAAGSYASVTHLTAAHRVPLPRLVPVGIDGGLVGTVLLDIVLTWTGYPVWWLRWLARLLTAGTIAANAASGWPDPVATGLHLAAPVMILAVVEATRSVLLRRPVTGGPRRESIPHLPRSLMRSSPRTGRG
jgi:hypothetical protein